MQACKSPGVYIDEINGFSMSVAGIDTAIPVFIGPTHKQAKDTQNNNVDEPIRIVSLAEYIENFGKAKAQKFQAELLRIEDANDSYRLKSLTLVSPDNKTDLYYQMQMFFANGGSTCYIYSTNAETWSEVAEKVATKDDITMVVLPDTFSSSYKEAIASCASLNRFLILGSEYKENNCETFREKVGTADLKRVAAYTPYLNTSLPYIIEDSEISIKCGSCGINKLSELKENNTQIYNQILADVSQVKVSELSPIGAMAGIYAKTDRDRGIWKAPANISLNSVISPNVDITAKEQESLNVDPTTGKSINAIRYFPGKGDMVWGARTLDGNSNEWRYISVRRTVSYVEQSLHNALQSYVFESNNEMTWLKVTTMIETFLNNLWREGGLNGTVAEEAYFVNLGQGTTMTDQDIEEGKMKISIGLATVKPAEFIILDVTQMLQK